MSQWPEGWRRATQLDPRDQEEVGWCYFVEERMMWFVERQDGSRVLLGQWPHSDLYCGRDENRRIIFKMREDGPGAQFIRFVDSF